MTVEQSLWGLEIFKGLTEDELADVSAIMEPFHHAEGEVIFKEGSHGDTLYVVTAGEVAITIRIAEGIEETLATMRAGDAFGEMALVDPGDRSATARVLADCTGVRLLRKTFFELAASDNALGIKVFLNMAVSLTDRLRGATDAQRKAVLWGHQISGATHLNFYHLIVDQTLLQVELVTGRFVSGILLKVDETKSGHELTLRDADEAIHIIPYASISAICVSAEQLTKNH